MSAYCYSHIITVVIIMKNYTLKPRVCTYTKLHVFVSNHNVISDSYDILLHIQREVKGGLKMQDIQFIYPARPGVTVLQSFNISVSPGKTLALVGPSGSGKSTVISLIERFYDPTAGSILFDGTDICELNISWYRHQIGLVSQEPVLFNISIGDNIRYGANFRDVSDEEVIQAAKSANIHEFIQSLPQVRCHCHYCQLQNYIHNNYMYIT